MQYLIYVRLTLKNIATNFTISKDSIDISNGTNRQYYYRSLAVFDYMFKWSVARRS